MKIVNNGYSIEVKNINGQKCLSLIDFANLDGHSYTEICRKVKHKQSLTPFIVRKDGSKVKNTHLTLEGCIKLCESFQFPNDEFIKKIKELQNRFDVKEPSFEKKIPAEQLIDIEMKRLDNEKQDFEDLNRRVSNLEVKTNNIVACLSISKAQLKERIEDLENKLEDIDNNLSRLNDKPNQSSFKDLLKECIKDIIREELTNERA